jgi:Transcriptional regulator, AbiEi antitoxin/Protein of unknown function (DUF559)
VTSPPPGGLGDNRRIAPAISQAIDAAIIEVAARQNGIISRRQLLDLGLTDDAIRHRLSTGRLYRVYPGVYSVGRPVLTPHERASAAVLACGPGAALSHGSAMVLWNYWRQWEMPLEVTLVGDRRPKGIRVHRSTTLRRRDVTRQLGIRVTTPARTIFDISPRQTDRAFKRTVNNALHSLWLTEGQLADAARWHPNLPAAERVAKLIGLPGTPTRSGWEDEFPGFCQRHGLPAPVMGAPLAGYIVDALFVAERVIVELDSWPFHKDKPAFETDRERDATTLALGFVTVRVTAERLDERPRKEAERLHAILAQRRRSAHAPSAA